MSIEKLERPPVEQERLETLRSLFPDVMSDGRVNLERLRELLEGQTEELSAGEAHYGLSWPGREGARRAASKPPSGSLLAAPDQGVDESSTQNLLIVGDNLEVLRMLQKGYANRVKLIYIDPPYNTGNDFIYKDNFADPVHTYLEATRQADFTGLLTSNPRSSGRYHSSWLSMMYPRLALARNLLQETGSIFVSIDDHELHNLRLVMDEVFGAENFVATVAWQKVFAVKNSTAYFSSSHEFVLVYAKSIENWNRNLLPRTTEQLSDYKNPDNDPRGVWNSVALSARNPYSEGLWSCNTPSGRFISGPPTGRYWAVSWKKFQELNADNRIWWGQNGDGVPRRKVFLSEVQQGIVPETIWFHEEAGNTQEAKKELLERVTFASSDSVFDTPKPTRLIEKVLRIGTTTDTEDIVLDFFAGSGTTGEAVWKLNKADGGNRRFILVQLPEVTGQPDYPTIADITRTRLKNASQALKKAVEGTLPFGGSVTPDFGFRVLQQGPSNVRRFAPFVGTETSALLPLLRKESGLMPHSKSENVLIEILLVEGYPLDSARQQHADFLSNVVTQIEHPHIPVSLLVCLDDQIEEETAEVLARAEFEKVIFICLETALTDTVKVRLSDVVHQVKTL